MKICLIVLLLMTSNLQTTLSAAPAPAVPPAKITQTRIQPTITGWKAGERIIDGEAKGWRHKVRVKVYSESGPIVSRDALVEASDDSFTVIVRVPLSAGQIIQAFLLSDNGVESLPSVPIAVKAAGPGAPPVAPSNTTATVTPTPAPPVVAAPAPPDPCAPATANAVLAAPSISPLSADDGKVTGNPVFLAGTISVCVAGKLHKIKVADTDTSSDSVDFKGGTYSVILDPLDVAGSEKVTVVVTSPDKKQRLTNTATVAASTRPDPNKPCVASAGSGSPILFDPPLQNAVTKVTGTVPFPEGNVVACFKGAPLAPATGVTADKDGKFTLTLTAGVKENQTIDFLVTSKDLKSRIKTSVDVAPVMFTKIELTSTPHEGQNALNVSASKSGLVNYSLSAYVNGQRVPLIVGGLDAFETPTSVAGATTLQLKTPLEAGDCVQVLEFETGKQPPSSDNLAVKDKACAATEDLIGPTFSRSKAANTDAFFDFGRIHTELAAGTLFSFDGGNFSQPSVFLGLKANRNWYWKGMSLRQGASHMTPARRIMFDTFFEARLTTIPVASCPAATPAATATPAPAPVAKAVGTDASGAPAPAAPSDPCPKSGVVTTNVQSVLASPKAGEWIGGASIPFVLTTWQFGSRPYGFSLGPIAKVGFITPVGSQTTGTTQPTSNHSFYTNYGFGTRMGFHKLTPTSDTSPETLSYIDVLTGRYSNFDNNPYPLDFTYRYSRPWRFNVEGLLRLPSTPFYMGFSANVHQNFGLGNSKTVDNARDDLRFFFGAKFDAGKLFETLKLQ